jgi:hypothetical protein
MRKPTYTKDLSGKISGSGRKRNTTSRRATLESNLEASGTIDRDEPMGMDEYDNTETAKNISCNRWEEPKEGEREAVANAEELVLDYTRLLPKNKRDTITVRWIRNGVMIIDEMVYKRSAGDQDIVNKRQAQNMVTRGDVRIEK